MQKIRYRPHPLLAYPTQPVFLALVVSIPFLIIGGLWRDGLLSTATVAAAFDGTALLCLVMPVTTAWRTDAMEREYRGYRQEIDDELSDPDLDEKGRQLLLVELSKLDAQFHFLHDRQGTLQKVKFVGAGMRLASRYLRKASKSPILSVCFESLPTFDRQNLAVNKARYVSPPAYFLFVT